METVMILDDTTSKTRILGVCAELCAKRIIKCTTTVMSQNTLYCRKILPLQATTLCVNLSLKMLYNYILLFGQMPMCFLFTRYKIL